LGLGFFQFKTKGALTCRHVELKGVTSETELRSMSVETLYVAMSCQDEYFRFEYLTNYFIFPFSMTDIKKLHNLPAS
jgi:hypothetical protein